MIVLVANLGSTSFKFKLYDIDAENQRALARGSADRIGLGQSNWAVSGDTGDKEGQNDLADHAAAIDFLLGQLPGVGFDRIDQLDAIGFKAVHGGPICSAVRVDESVIDTMQQFADVAPAHNPPYIAAMRAFTDKLPDVPQVTAFETAFHQSIPMARQVYGTPYEWVEMGVRRYGFHGASNAYIARRMAQITHESRRIINFHLGGSSSVCAIRDGRSVAHSMGTTPQTGLFHANRVGDFDTFALLKLLGSGLTLDQIFERLGKEGGLAGLSGVSADMRQIKEEADKGNERAQLAIDALVESCRHYLGAYLVVLGGADAITFTAGIGQHSPWMRSAICAGLESFGIALDESANQNADGNRETCISKKDATTAVWVLPTDEELIVARQTYEVLTGSVN